MVNGSLFFSRAGSLTRHCYPLLSIAIHCSHEAQLRHKHLLHQPGSLVCRDTKARTKGGGETHGGLFPSLRAEKEDYCLHVTWQPALGWFFSSVDVWLAWRLRHRNERYKLRCLGVHRKVPMVIMIWWRGEGSKHRWSDGRPHDFDEITLASPGAAKKVCDAQPVLFLGVSCKEIVWRVDSDCWLHIVTIFPIMYLMMIL